MKKKLFSAAAAGALLLASTGAVGGIISTPTGTGVSGFLTITGFAVTDPDPNIFTATFTGLNGTINFTDTSFINSHIKLFGAGYIDPSVTGPLGYPPVGASTDIKNFNTSGATVFTGTGSADFPVDSVTFDGTNTPSIGIGNTFSFSYDGYLNLLGFLLGNPAYNNILIKGSLTGTVADVTSSSLTLNFNEACNTPPAGPSGGSCIYELLQALNASGSTPTDNMIDAAFGFAPDTNLVVPEPASLALMGIGIAGLGIIRRKKAA